jgi:quercetin dioxygenase-like cupin family protein
MLPFFTTILARSPDEYAEWAYHEGEIFLHVLEGTMLFYSEFYKPLHLSKSDCLYYDGTMRHLWVSESEKDAKAIWIFGPTS